jgi:hypothetical protein
MRKLDLINVEEKLITGIRNFVGFPLIRSWFSSKVNSPSCGVKKYATLRVISSLLFFKFFPENRTI